MANLWKEKASDEEEEEEEEEEVKSFPGAEGWRMDTISCILDAKVTNYIENCE